MDIKERAESSNEEPVIIDNVSGVILNLTSHMAYNKVLMVVKRNPLGKEFGFFKKVGKSLQVHLCIPGENDTKEWHRFYVLEATDDEKQRNRRLNVLR